MNTRLLSQGTGGALLISIKATLLRRKRWQRDVTKYIFIISPGPHPSVGSLSLQLITTTNLQYSFKDFLVLFILYFCSWVLVLFQILVDAASSPSPYCVFSPYLYSLRDCVNYQTGLNSPNGGLNRVPKYRKKTFYLWYPENLFSGSYITCGAAVPVSVSYFTELCGSALKPSRHWSVWSAQLRDVGKGVWQVHGRCRHSLCQRDFWRLVWHKAVWTTYQRFSPSRVFFFPLLSIAPLFTFFSLLYPSLFICLVPRCFASVSGLASSLSYFSLGLVVSSFHSRPFILPFFPL